MISRIYFTCCKIFQLWSDWIEMRSPVQLKLNGVPKLKTEKYRSNHSIRNPLVGHHNGTFSIFFSGGSPKWDIFNFFFRGSPKCDIFKIFLGGSPKCDIFKFFFRGVTKMWHFQNFFRGVTKMGHFYKKIFLLGRKIDIFQNFF